MHTSLPFSHFFLVLNLPSSVLAIQLIEKCFVNHSLSHLFISLPLKSCFISIKNFLSYCFFLQFFFDYSLVSLLLSFLYLQLFPSFFIHLFVQFRLDIFCFIVTQSLTSIVIEVSIVSDPIISLSLVFKVFICTPLHVLLISKLINLFVSVF